MCVKTVKIDIDIASHYFSYDPLSGLIRKKGRNRSLPVGIFDTIRNGKTYYNSSIAVSGVTKKSMFNTLEKAIAFREHWKEVLNERTT